MAMLFTLVTEMPFKSDEKSCYSRKNGIPVVMKDPPESAVYLRGGEERKKERKKDTRFSQIFNFKMQKLFMYKDQYQYLRILYNRNFLIFYR